MAYLTWNLRHDATNSPPGNGRAPDLRTPKVWLCVTEITLRHTFKITQALHTPRRAVCVGRPHTFVHILTKQKILFYLTNLISIVPNNIFVCEFESL